MKFGRALWVGWIIGMLLCSGCDALFFDVTEVEFVETDPSDMPDDADDAGDMTTEDMTSDMSDMVDMTDMTDMTDMSDMSDMSDMTDMTDMDPGPGTICTAGGELFGSCHPITQDCTPSTDVCDFFFNTGEGRLEAGCNSAASDYVIPEGAPCMGQMDKCEPALLCTQGICQRMCDRNTAAECRSDEFCRTFDPMLEIGFCSSSCN